MLLHQTQHVHEVLGVYVVGIQLHLGLDRTVADFECLSDDLPEWLDEIGLVLADAVPPLLTVTYVQNIPVGRLLAGVLLNGYQHLIDKEGHLQEPLLTHMVCEDIQSLGQILHRSTYEFSNIFEIVTSLACLLLALFFLVVLNRKLNQFLRSQTLSVFDHQHLSDKVSNGIADRDITREAKDGVIDEGYQFRDGAFLVWAQAIQHLVEDYPQRPDIRPDVVNESLQHLGSHVDRRTYHRLCHVVFFQQFLAEPKVSQFDDPIVKQDVGRFQIPMQDVLIVQFLEGTLQLSEYLECFRLSQFSLLLDVLSKSASVAVFIDQVVVVGCPQHFDELDDVGVADLGEDGYFVIGELAEFGCMFELLNIHDLDCVVLMGLPVLGPVDVAVLSLPDLLQEHVVFNHLIH